jgi:hypothetical protein
MEDAPAGTSSMTYTVTYEAQDGWQAHGPGLKQ